MGNNGDIYDFMRFSLPGRLILYLNFLTPLIDKSIYRWLIHI